MGQEETSSLIDRAVSGDREAFTRILDAYGGRLFSFAHSLTGDAATAEDIVQDAFLVLLRRPDAYREERGALLSFLLGVTRNLALKELRRRSRYGPLDPVLDIPGATESEVGGGNLGHARLKKACSGLTPIQRQVVSLRFEQELALKDISETLLLPLNTVKSHLRRAVGCLREALGREEDPDGL